jgi:hypothetical protein
MKLAIMQPYLFPYIGYFQLVKAVDRFIVYDDVAFIKQGWINRNYIAAGDGVLLFSVPLANVSSHTLIRDTRIDRSSYARWRKKFLQTLMHSYGRAPFFETVYPSVERIFAADPLLLKDLLLHGLRYVVEYLDLQTVLAESAEGYGNGHLKGVERVLDICRQEGASDYYNLTGGKHLYDRNTFARSSIRLHFIEPNGSIQYMQGKRQAFIPRLSMLDVLMYNSPDAIRAYLDAYETA